MIFGGRGWGWSGGVTEHELRVLVLSTTIARNISHPRNS